MECPSVGFKPHISRFLILAALALPLAVGRASGTVEEPRNSQEQAENTLVRLNITTESRGASESIEINGKRISNYRPTIIQVFPSTGVVLDEKGHVLTFLGYSWVDMGSNNPRVEILTSEGQRYKGKLIGIDQKLGVAVVASQEGKLKKTPICLKCEIRDGATVVTPVVEGSGFAQFEEARIVSVASLSDAEQRDGWMLTVNRPLPGVGEPILNTDHQVLGFVAGQRPSSDDPMGARSIVYPMSRLLSLAEKIIHVGGDILTGWLGIYLEDYHSAFGNGVLVTQVEDNSPAQKAGLAPEDILLKWNGKQIKNERQFIRLVEDSKIGSKIALEVLRGGRAINLSTLIEARKPSETSGKLALSFPNFVTIPGREGVADSGTDQPRPRVGIETVQLTPELADFLHIPGQSGLLVLKVDQRTAANQAGVLVGDVILAVDGERILDPQIFSSHIQSRGWGGRLMLKLLRKGAERTTIIHLPKFPSEPKRK